MPDQPTSAFISYSRTDSTFVDRLEADLQARSFQTWVDRRKLEGGQDWMDILQHAIDRCHVLLVVLSPEAVKSKYVRMEYRYASQKGKQVIPLEYQSCEDVPMDLNDIQWVDFKNTYDQGLRDLLIALNPVEPGAITAPEIEATQVQEPFNPATVEEEPVLVVPQPAPSPPDPDLIHLFREGAAAKADGNLERTAILWQQVLDRDHSFGNSALVPEMEQLRRQLHPIRVQRLRERAEKAHIAGGWGQEIGSWNALLGLVPEDPQAKERIPVAEHNQKYVWLYESAEQDVQDTKLAAARVQLEMLWRNAPYYGDPAGLAMTVKMEAPLNYSATKIKEAETKRNQFVVPPQANPIQPPPSRQGVLQSQANPIQLPPSRQGAFQSQQRQGAFQSQQANPIQPQPSRQGAFQSQQRQGAFQSQGIQNRRQSSRNQAVGNYRAEERRKSLFKWLSNKWLSVVYFIDYFKWLFIAFFTAGGGVVFVLLVATTMTSSLPTLILNGVLGAIVGFVLAWILLRVMIPF